MFITINFTYLSKKRTKKVIKTIFPNMAHGTHGTIRPKLNFAQCYTRTLNAQKTITLATFPQ